MAKLQGTPGVTPAGIAVYPRVSGKPDTKFDERGLWTIRLRLPAEEASTLLEQLQEGQKEALQEAREEGKVRGKGKLADLPFSEEEDGSILFNFKMPHKVTSKKTKETYEFKPAIFDAAGQPLKDVRLGGGSKVKVAYELRKFYTALVGAGVQLRLRAVQVLDLVEYEGGGTAGSFGFESEEGYQAQSKGSPFAGGDADSDDDDADDGDGDF